MCMSKIVVGEGDCLLRRRSRSEGVVGKKEGRRSSYSRVEVKPKAVKTISKREGEETTETKPT